MSEILKEELERIEKAATVYTLNQFIDYGDHNHQAEEQINLAYRAGAKAEHSYLQGRIAQLEKEKDSDFPQIFKDIRDENERLKGDVIVRDYDLKKQSQEIKRLCGQVEDLKNKLIQEQFKNGNHGG